MMEDIPKDDDSINDNNIDDNSIDGEILEDDRINDESIEEKSTDDQHSPESAGVVRGLSRSVQNIAKRAAIGRLPEKTAGEAGRKVVSATAKRAAKAGKIPRSARRLRRAHRGGARVAKISDRASKGMDLVSSLDDAFSSPPKSTSKKSSDVWNHRLMLVAKRALDFTKNLAQNTILGAAVFSTYEMSIQKLDTVKTCDSPTDDDDDVYAKVSIPHHFFSGALAGSVHGILDESITVMTKRTFPSVLPSLTMMLHHAISHSVLFGSYESFKRFFLHSYDKNMPSQQHDHHHTIHISTIAAAGGFAGSLQHVVSLVTEELASNSFAVKNNHNRQYTLWTRVWSGLKQNIHLVTLPTLRSTVLSFPPAAIGFVAFEYGKDIVSGATD